MRTIKLLLAAGFLLVLGTSAYAQVQRNETYLPKFAIKTNALYWATSTPNLGFEVGLAKKITLDVSCLLYTSPSPRDGATSRMPSSA